MSVLSNETNTFSALLLELVSIYMKLSPIGGKLIAPLSPIGNFFC